MWQKAEKEKNIIIRKNWRVKTNDEMRRKNREWEMEKVRKECKKFRFIFCDYNSDAKQMVEYKNE